ncbi:hypothetical protein [Pseudoroseicyclus tamaricis]|uniref:Uncharacterized protein n=1 Tax=Pseudoroseicyclus tamaricis TaxID=2705421 RepID=A0A6B2JPK0_9RHOB|nr:hypothetical protein [Pseudoroseicyclus tamaricis]NDV00028.1 hypothetical protein [Pseudoroseicyclus tamaricis]
MSAHHLEDDLGEAPVHLDHDDRQDDRARDRPGTDANALRAKLLVRQLPLSHLPQRGGEHLDPEERRPNPARMTLDERAAEVLL